MSTRRPLDEPGWGPDPVAAPLSYPGRPPDGPASLLLDRSLLWVRPSGEPPGSWQVVEAGLPLDAMLSRHGAAPMAARHPVLAVGSNGSPAQLHRKFTGAGMRPTVPITAVRVEGLIAGVSAHVNRAGYLPATPVAVAGTVSDLWVTWLDDRQLTAMDATEPNYRRLRLPAGCQARLPCGRGLPGCYVYASRHGHLIHRDGSPRGLPGQVTLITELLAEVPGLSGPAGNDPREWVSRTAEPGVRERIRHELQAHGLVREGFSSAAR